MEECKGEKVDSEFICKIIDRVADTEEERTRVLIDEWIPVYIENHPFVFYVHYYFTSYFLGGPTSRRELFSKQDDSKETGMFKELVRKEEVFLKKRLDAGSNDFVRYIGVVGDRFVIKIIKYLNFEPAGNEDNIPILRIDFDNVDVVENGEELIYRVKGRDALSIITKEITSEQVCDVFRGTHWKNGCSILLVNIKLKIIFQRMRMEINLFIMQTRIKKLKQI